MNLIRVSNYFNRRKVIWGKNGEGEGPNKELHRHVYGRSRLCEGEVIEGILSMNLPPERDL